MSSKDKLRIICTNEDGYMLVLWYLVALLISAVFAILSAVSENIAGALIFIIISLALNPVPYIVRKWLLLSYRPTIKDMKDTLEWQEHDEICYNFTQNGRYKGVVDAQKGLIKVLNFRQGEYSILQYNKTFSNIDLKKRKEKKKGNDARNATLDDVWKEIQNQYQNGELYK